MLFTGTRNLEDLEEAEESKAVAELVDCNYVNRISQISSSRSSSNSSSIVQIHNNKVLEQLELEPLELIWLTRFALLQSTSFATALNS